MTPKILYITSDFTYAALCKALHKVATLPDGVVFLPAAGDRYISNVRHVGSHGYYSINVSNAYYVYFSYNYVIIYDHSVYRREGHSVRLVTEVE